MPNEDIDWTPLDSLEKYRSYTRYVRAAEEADRRMFGGRPIGNTERKRRKKVIVITDGPELWIHTSSIAVIVLQVTFTRATISVWVSEHWLFLWAAVEPVNIGLPYQRPSRKTEVKERKKVMLESKKNPEMERDNRLRTCKCISEPSWSLKRKQSRLIKSRMIELWLNIFTQFTVGFKGILKITY